MPWLRVNGMAVHVKMAKRKAPAAPTFAPALCRAPFMGGVCACESSYLCDYPVNEAGETCDMPMCGQHAHQVGRDKHYCPKHLKVAHVLGDRKPGPQRSLFEGRP